MFSTFCAGGRYLEINIWTVLQIYNKHRRNSKMGDVKADSREAKMEFVIDERQRLRRDDLRAIARILHRHDPKCLNYSATGARVCLKKLPDSVLNNIHAFVRAKTIGKA